MSKTESKSKGPSFFQDWLSSPPAVLVGARECPIVFCLLLLLSIARALWHPHLPFSLCWDVVQMAILGYICYFIYTGMAHTKAGDGSLVSRDFHVLKAVVLVGLALFVVDMLLMLLLFIPCLWFGTICSLAMVVAAMEKTPIVGSFKRGRELVNGSFWLAFRYAWLGPFVVLILWAIPTHIYWLWEGLPKQSASHSMVHDAFAVIDMLGANLLALSFAPPSVLLFWYLRDKKGLT